MFRCRYHYYNVLNSGGGVLIRQYGDKRPSLVYTYMYSVPIIYNNKFT